MTWGYLVETFGGPEVMVWSEFDTPEPAPDEVVVDVRASGINFAETRMRAGTYTGQPLPYVAGMECAGIVSAVGSEVTSLTIGQRVFGRARGSHAQQVAVAAEHLFVLPDNLSFVEGAAIPVGWLTAWHALHTVAGIEAGNRVLIEAVASSVGSAALQIAKAAGCWAAGTASRDDKLFRAQAYGADLLINYKTDSVSERIQAATDNAGVNVGLMTIGEETAQALMDSMGMDGKIVMYGSTGGRKICFDLVIGTRNLQLLSMSISTSPQFMPGTMTSFREQALPLFADGQLKAVVDVVLPISELARAHVLVDDRSHFGKIIMEVDS